jgi:EmrB/QacA subfamily drug resistance transporter
MTTRSNMTYQEKRAYQRRWWTLAVVIVAVIAIGLDQTVLNVAIPTLQRELGASASELIWMVDAYIVVFAATLLITGALGDRYGRAKAFYLGLVIFGLSSLGAAYSQNTGQLIASRAVMGVSGALLMTSTLSIVTNVFPRQERGRAIGVWAGVSAMGIFLGPVIGGALLENFWWGSVFLINVPVAAVALIAGLFLVPDSRDPNAGTIDYPGFLLSMAAISLLVYGIIEAPSRGWTDPVVLATLIASAPLTVAFIWWEMRTASPLLNLQFFSHPRFSAGVAGTGMASFARLGAGFGLTQYLQFVQGYSPLEAGVRMLPLVLGIAVGAGFSDRLVKRMGTNWVVSGGMLLLAGGLAAVVFWQPETAFWIVGVNLFVIAFGVGNVMAPSTDAVMGAVPEEKAGVGSAMNGVARMVAGALGAAVIGSLMYTIYGNMMVDAVSALPAQAAEAASDSVGAAIYLAETLPAPYGQALASEAAAAFTDSFGWAVLVGAGVALVAAVLVAVYMPPRHLEKGQDEELFDESLALPAIQTGD